MRPLIIYDCMPLQAKTGVDSLPDRGVFCGFCAGPGLGTKKQHVLQQPFRRNGFALGQGSTHHQHPRSHAFGVNIFVEQPVGHGIEIGSRHLPENAHGHFGLRLRKTQTNIAHA